MIALRWALALLIVLAGLPGDLALNRAAEAQEKPPQFVSGPEISTLIRTTTVALHNANSTGNYTVLRDLGSIRFQAEHSTARLTDLFRVFRDQNVSLAATVLLDPILSKPAELSTNGLIKLEGYFATRPQEVIFNMAFLYERGRWRLASLNVGARPAPDPDSQTKDGDAAADAKRAPPSIPRPRPR